MAYIGTKPADAVLETDDITDGVVTSAKIADGTITSTDVNYPLTTFSSTGIDDNATANALTIDSSSNLQFNSGYGSVATAYGCRAWVNFNGTGTVAINASGNVSSITDHSTGNYTANFTTAMPDVNYSAVGSTIGSVSGNYATYVNGDNTALSTAGVRIEIRNSVSGSVLDMPSICLGVIR